MMPYCAVCQQPTCCGVVLNRITSTAVIGVLVCQPCMLSPKFKRYIALVRRLPKVMQV